MTKKIGWVAVGFLIVVVIFAMSRMRAHMMGGAGSPTNLSAVSASGAPAPLSADVEALTGKLENGAAAQKSGEMIVSLALNPYPPIVGQNNFSVKLADAKGKAIDDATISLDLTMPSMWMPPNKLDMAFASDGKYEAAGQFTMRGGWRIEVIITRAGQTQSVFFDVGL